MHAFLGVWGRGFGSFVKDLTSRRTAVWKLQHCSLRDPPDMDQACLAALAR
jgi:hypothetical protein